MWCSHVFFISVWVFFSGFSGFLPQLKIMPRILKADSKLSNPLRSSMDGSLPLACGNLSGVCAASLLPQTPKRLVIGTEYMNVAYLLELDSSQLLDLRVKKSSTPSSKTTHDYFCPLSYSLKVSPHNWKTCK